MANTVFQYRLKETHQLDLLMEGGMRNMKKNDIWLNLT